MARTYGHIRQYGRLEPHAPPWSRIAGWLFPKKHAGGSSGKFPLTREKIAFLLPQLPGWRVEERNGIPRLERSFVFPNLEGALAFAVKVSALGQSDGRRAALLVEHQRVTVSWWTLASGGLLREDFDYAARTDALYQQG